MGVVSRHDLVKLLARPNEELAASVRMALDEGGLQSPQIEVTVSGGIAQLRGEIDPATLRLAEVLLRGIPGVLQVRADAKS